MPRSVHKVIKFDGGLNDDSDARDLKENELSEAKDIMVDRVGKVILMGGPGAVSSPDWNTLIASATTITNAPIGNVVIGYGVHIFASDYHVTGSSGGKNFLALAGLSTTGSTATANKKYFIGRIWEDDGVSFAGTITINSNTSQTAVSLTNTTYAFQPNYYYADGGLRLSDGNFSNTSSTNQWFGYIKRNHFGDDDSYNDWYVKTNSLAAPTYGVAGVGPYGSCTTVASPTVTLKASATNAFTGWGTELNGVYSAYAGTDAKFALITTRDDNQTLTIASATGLSWTSGEIYYIVPPAGTGFNVDILGVADGNGLFTATGTYEFASTFIYDGTQESKLFEMIGSYSITATTDSITPRALARSPFDPRISGGRIYWRIQNTTNDWNLLLDIDMNDGARFDFGSDYVAWYQNSAAMKLYGIQSNPLASSENIEEPFVDTYRSLTGIDDQDKDITAKFKTAVVTNRRAYLGNVHINGKSYEDSIFKSFVNRFDTVTEDMRIDVAVDDGDQVVKLETYADRIIEFKKKTVYIINIAQDVEFLESEHKYLGIDYPYQAVQTEYGIAWINVKGCYLYNGRNVIDLFLDLQDPRRRKINLTNWDTFLGTNPSVAYDANNKKLIVFADLSGADIDVLIYDFVTGSWTHGVDKYDVASANYANPVTDWDGDVILYNDGNDEIYQWSNDAAGSAGLDFKLPDLDFGYPGIKKNLYKVRITYQSGGEATNVQVRYDTNGGTSFTKDFTPVTNATLDSTISELDLATGWATAELEPDTTSESHNIYSVQLKFFVDSGTTTCSGFQLNDVTFIYRVKGNR